MEKETPQKWVDAVWRSNANIIYKICESKCGSAEDAKDLFQTVALKFCQNAKSLKERSTVLPWMACVLHNAHCDMVAERHATYPMSQVAKKDDDFFALSEEKSIFFNVNDNSMEDVDGLLAHLSPFERMIVEMTYIGGVRTDEISAIVGISCNSIRKRRHFAINKIRATLLEQE